MATASFSPTDNDERKTRTAVAGPDRMRLCDAHNHLQDERFGGRQAELVAACREAGITRMVVNGSCEEDWPQVAELARRFPDLVIPSFGYHPWYVDERTGRWRETLSRFLDDTPGAAIGEIGLDRWKPGLSYVAQEEVFVWQLRQASARNRPASIHCLGAWGRMLELLREGPRPRCGFLLHSYGGSTEMVGPLAELGARFGFPGYFLHERKTRQREAFKHVPPDRLLIETDAPDQLPPGTEDPTSAPSEGGTSGLHRFTDPETGRALNHPANLALIHRLVAEMLGLSPAELATRIAENFERLFGAR